MYVHLDYGCTTTIACQKVVEFHLAVNGLQTISKYEAYHDSSKVPTDF